LTLFFFLFNVLAVLLYFFLTFIQNYFMIFVC